jgi:signal transduction histidine kinase
MNKVSPPIDAVTRTILEALPIGVAVFDAGRRAVVVNPAYCESLALPADSFPLGTKLDEMIRQAAYRGVFGPGDPETQIRQQMQVDRTRSGRLRQRHFSGRSYDVFIVPLPAGGHAVCAVETTALLSARDAAESLATRLAGAVATLRIGIVAFGPDRTLLLYNPRFAELMGLPLARLHRGLSFSELMEMMQAGDEYGGLEDENFVAAQAALDRGHPASARRVRANGQVIEIASDPLPDGGWTMTVTDISPLAVAEDDSRRRATMLDGLLASIPHGICVYGPDRRVTMFNPAYEAVMAGAPLAVGDHMEDIVRRRAESGEYGSGAPGATIRREMSRNIASPQARRRRRPNGTMIDVRTAPLPDGGHVSVVTDVTPLGQAEEEVARGAAEMDAMLANIRHGITLWSADKRLLAFNRAVAELLELPPDFLERGLHLHALLDHMAMVGGFGTGPQAGAALEQRKTHDRTQPLVSQRTTSSGRILEIRSAPVAGGGYIVTHTDITDIRAAEAELRRAKEAAESANTSKARFVATMSHELRTPLNAVIGFSDALVRDRGRTDPTQVLEFAQEINAAGRRLLLLVNNILDVSRIEAGRFDLGTDRIDFSRLVQICLRQARSAASAGEIDLRNELPASVPLVRGDERRMQQVLTNLLSNAIKFTEPGGSATVSAAIDDNSDLLVRVIDTGIGIEEAHIDRVFEPFTQVDAELSRRYDGTGLGLYFSRALVEAHGGTLTLKSRLGEGTTAEVRMPTHRVIAAAADANPQEPA